MNDRNRRSILRTRDTSTGKKAGAVYPGLFYVGKLGF